MADQNDGFGVCGKSHDLDLENEIPDAHKDVCFEVNFVFHKSYVQSRMPASIELSIKLVCLS